MTQAQSKLKELWVRCFPDDALNDPDRLTRGEGFWQEQRFEHLPLTLEIMTGSHESARCRYGRPQQGQQGTPTLLLMTGYSPEQLALVIAAHVRSGCGTVVPFTGSGVWSAVQAEVVSCLSLLDVDARALADPVVVDSASPADVFRKLVAWIREHPGACCAIDCTGGKKPMDSGAAHAASFYGLPAYYLDFDRYHTALRRPLPWTCIYRELPLPDAAFGLESRQRVFEAFRNRRFGTARLAMTDVVQHAQSSGFFEGIEFKELQQADGLIAKAAAWMDLRYHEIADHPLVDAFTQVTQIEPRRIVEELLAPDRFDDLFCYTADEYWRLGLLFDAGEVREALVGLVGLAELAVDRIFREPWFTEVRVTCAVAVEWLRVTELRALPDLHAWNGLPLPVGCLPPSSFAAKIRLLRRGAATFDVWGWPTEDGANLREVSPGWNDARLVARVKAELASPANVPLGGASNRLWEQWFGDFPQGGWVQNRHALAHLRAPLLAQNAIERVRQARDVFVPRLIEALRRIHAGEPIEWDKVGHPDWVRWQQMEPWRKTDRAPWDEEQCLSDLEGWLGLRL